MNPGRVDIADIVLESDKAVLVVENFYTSDGHGHSYDDYLGFSKRAAPAGAVVILCRDRDDSLLRGGWENATILTYDALVDRLHAGLTRDLSYQTKHPDAFSLIDQMHRKYGKGTKRMDDSEVLAFVTAMCTTGEAGRYQSSPVQAAAEKFADDLAQPAMLRFLEGRELLRPSNRNSGCSQNAI